MSESTTQCPRCRTTFRVTAAQLQAAAGAVRCGSCMHIFDANALRTGSSADNGAPSSSTASTPLTSHASAIPTIDDDAAVFDDGFEDDDQDAAPESLAADPSSAHYPHSFLDLDDWEEEPRSIFSDIDELDSELDLDSEEQWAHQLLRELEEEEEEQADPAPVEQSIDPVPETGIELDESGIEEHGGQLTEDPTVSDDPLNDLFDTPLRAQRDDILAPLPPLRAEPRTGHRQLLDLEQEPLQLSRDIPAPRGRTWLYGLLAAVAVIALAGQYLFFNFDRIALGPQRAQIMRLCDRLGCQLPQRSAPELIRVGSLMVRSHPDRTEALVVDAILTNQASFAQPYPALLLVFSDLSGAAMAARSFQPDEYLAGEQSGSGEMASRQPVHIALELVDPGPRAVNYELHLEAAAQTGSTPLP